MTNLRFMGEGDPEALRGRVYGAPDVDDDFESKRRAFVEKLAAEGVIEAPAYDEWLARLRQRGWVTDHFEPAPGGGHYRRWVLSSHGHLEWARIK